MKKREAAYAQDSDEVVGKAFDVRIVRRMFEYIAPYKLPFVLAITASLFIAGLELVVGEAVKRVLDGPLAPAVTDGTVMSGDSAALDELALWSAAIFVIILVSASLKVFQALTITTVAQRAMRDLRVEVFEHVQRHSLRFFDRNPVGRLVTRVVHDVEALSQMLTSGLDAIFHDIILLAGIIVWLLLVNWKVAVAVFAVVPLIIIATRLFRNMSRAAFRLVRERVARVNSDLQESIQGLAVIQAYVQEDKLTRRFEDENADLMAAHLKTVSIFSAFFPLMELLSSIGVALLIWRGGGLMSEGLFTMGELTQFVFYVGLFFRPLRNLAEKFNILQSSIASAERLFKLRDQEPDLTSPADGLRPERLRGDVAFEDVTFSYTEGTPVLEGIDFRVASGETVALVGATGAGKTTVASLVTRLYDVDSGRVTVDGHDVREYDLPALRGGIAVVPQDVFLFAGTIEENLRMGDDSLTHEQLEEACRAVGADRIISRLPDGLASTVGERGASLSVGERQLLALARALAQDPALLILDEATSSVDSETEHLIQQALDRLQEGRTTLVVAHRLSTIRKCDRILVFHKGHLREHGTHDELVAADGIYATLHRLQFAA